MAVALTIDDGDSPEKMRERMITENPVVVVSLRSCCMCHAMKTLLSTVGVKAAVIELEETEASSSGGYMQSATAPAVGSPVLFIGGEVVGGIERLMAMHLSGRLVPRLQEVGASFQK
ncbi:glutaredoxin-C6-like [Dendrobium catenatum]|uniref:Glutaredoxin-C6 n=1 Tax=Dendrobium catenatum TaxID=906689 RepID=A0A2I0WCH7_9ASPA|nr:glutaredoxin-C6-like [Dendrobium catenatum]PKU73364.1 Glutaredoxin-C6 [Dendrobium catenatum]